MAYILMTPGFAKSRKELFWLPYPEPDKVIINSHNFTPATFDPSVNGKSAFAAHVPSRDDANNDTTVLKDFAGTNNGTLTNMATPANNWVDDTSAGGVRALLFDGSNDYVANMGVQNLASPLSWSMWVYRVSGTYMQICGQGRGDTTGLYLNADTGGSVSLYPVFLSSATANVPGNTWTHLCVTWDGTTAKLYVNAVLKNSGTTWGRSNSVSHFELGRVNFSGTFYYDGANKRIDDCRRYNSALELADVQALHVSGLGRGISA